MTSYIVKTLGPQDAAAVKEIQQIALDVLPAADLYYPLTDAEIRSMLGSGGRMLGMYAEGKGRLIAFQAMYFPGSHPDNLGRDLGLPPSECERVAHLEASAVHPDHRGNGLQRKLASIFMEQLQEEGRYPHICATTAPDNIPSVVNKLNNGMLLLQIKSKYNGALRSLFHKNLFKPLAIDSSYSTTVAWDDVQAQIELLNQGYAGYRWIKNEEKAHILFGALTQRLNEYPATRET